MFWFRYLLWKLIYLTKILIGLGSVYDVTSQWFRPIRTHFTRSEPIAVSSALQYFTHTQGKPAAAAECSDCWHWWHGAVMRIHCRLIIISCDLSHLFSDFSVSMSVIIILKILMISSHFRNAFFKNCSVNCSQHFLCVLLVIKQKHIEHERKE